MKNAIPASRGGVRLLPLLAAAAVIHACSSSTDPGGGGGGGDVEIAFSPTSANITLTVGDSQEFRATVTGADQAQITWTADGEAVGTGPVYSHAAATVGADTVAVAVAAGERTAAREWYLTVEPDAALLPPAVPVTSLEHGVEPATVQVRWSRATATAHPIVEYLVACSYDGPVSAATWDAAIPLGSSPQDGTLFYQPIYGPDDGMVAGQEVWFAVRARDTAGQLSPIDGVYRHVLSYPWSLVVDVSDDQGRPLGGVILDYTDGRTNERDNTFADGTATLGPFSSVDSVTVATTSTATPAFDYTSPPVGAGTATLPIVLLQKHVVDHLPCDADDTADFLSYFRDATLTEGNGGRSTRLWRWDHYPLSVWIPQAESAAAGWDLDSLALDALAIWNDALGDVYLETAADAASADIVYEFRPLPGYNGFTTVLDPSGGIGTAIPRRMLIEIESGLDLTPNGVPRNVTEVSLHELGHALGHYGHTCDNDEGNLMDNSGAVGSLAAGPQNAFTNDELRTVEAVRRLPQGTDMARYEAR